MYDHIRARPAMSKHTSGHIRRHLITSPGSSEHIWALSKPTQRKFSVLQLQLCNPFRKYACLGLQKNKGLDVPRIAQINTRTRSDVARCVRTRTGHGWTWSDVSDMLEQILEST